MVRKVRQVKSELPGRFIKRKIKQERCKTPLRCSRRLRHLPPEHQKYYNIIRDRLKQEKLKKRQIISVESSDHVNKVRKLARRSLKYPLRIKNSKEVISIFSAPKISNKKLLSKRKLMAAKARGSSSCKPAIIKQEDFSKQRAALTRGQKSVVKKSRAVSEVDKDKFVENRKRYVLDVLNKGDTKAIEKLPSVGIKTAERIILYRQLNGGAINKLSQLSKMPKFPKKRYDNFLVQNFLCLTAK